MLSDPVRCEAHAAPGEHRVAILTLDAGRRLNALSMRAVALLREHLARLQEDDRVAVVVLHAASDKAFCAGGDLREMYSAENAAKAAGGAARRIASEHVRTFFEQEYRLDYALHTFPKPVLCWGHGMVMGGGLGLLAGCSHRVVTETSQLSMPEIAIGHFPDVGASWFLNRMPDAAGLFIALTGAAVGAGDAVDAKLADYRIAQSDKASVIDRILQQRWTNRREQNDASLDRILRSPQWSHRKVHRPLREHAELIHAVCSRSSAAEIYSEVAALASSPHPWLEAAARRMTRGYAGSVGLIHALLRRAAHLSLPQVFRLEYGVALRSVAYGQFLEGIRALIIDKDRQPRWDRTIGAATPEWVERTFLHPLPAGDDPLGNLELSAPPRDAKTWG